MKKIGTSLVRCLSSIVLGDVDLDDVLYLAINSANFSKCTTYDSLMSELRTLVSADVLLAYRPIVDLLWSTGRLYTPIDGIGVREILPTWIDVPPFDSRT